MKCAQWQNVTPHRNKSHAYRTHHRKMLNPGGKSFNPVIKLPVLTRQTGVQQSTPIMLLNSVMSSPCATRIYEGQNIPVKGLAGIGLLLGRNVAMSCHVVGNGRITRNQSIRHGSQLLILRIGMRPAYPSLPTQYR